MRKIDEVCLYVPRPDKPLPATTQEYHEELSYLLVAVHKLKHNPDDNVVRALTAFGSRLFRCERRFWPTFAALHSDGITFCGDHASSWHSAADYKCNEVHSLLLETGTDDLAVTVAADFDCGELYQRIAVEMDRLPDRGDPILSVEQFRERVGWQDNTTWRKRKSEGRLPKGDAFPLSFWRQWTAKWPEVAKRLPS